MRILGVDPGLKATGYGAIDIDNDSCVSSMSHGNHVKLLEAGTVEPNPRDPLQNKIHKVYKNLDEIILQFSPDVMVLEKIYAHYRHPATACVLGHVRGVICLLCAFRRLKLIEYSVKRIRKVVVGNGNASKQQTMESVANILKIDAEGLTLDASDALAMALGYAYMRTVKPKYGF